MKKDGKSNREEVASIIQARCQTNFKKKAKTVKQGEVWVRGKMAAVASFGDIWPRMPRPLPAS
jgi:hypothetical protein